MQEEQERKKRKRVIWLLFLLLLFWFVWQKCKDKPKPQTGVLSAPEDVPQTASSTPVITVLDGDDIVIGNENDFDKGTIFVIYNEAGIPVHQITKTQ
jgi:hypothetical protein